MKKSLPIFILILITGLSATAQTMRAPTSIEHEALMRVIAPINYNLEGFLDKNWMLDQGFDETALDVPISPKSHLAAAYLMVMKVKEGSPYFLEIMAPLQRLSESNNTDSMLAAGAIARRQSKVTVDVVLNAGVLEPGNHESHNKQWKLPGVAKAFTVVQNNQTPDPEGPVVLAFGHWQDATYEGSNQVYKFRFRHPPQSPLVENVVITLQGNPDKIKQILTNSDWRKVAQALDQ